MDIGHLISYVELLIWKRSIILYSFEFKNQSSYSNTIITFTETHTSFVFADLLNDLRKNCTELESTPSVCDGSKKRPFFL